MVNLSIDFHEFSTIPIIHQGIHQGNHRESDITQVFTLVNDRNPIIHQGNHQGNGDAQFRSFTRVITS